ncbi:MAG TPA: helix-turn-helix domain-containing protein [Gammaproteobacteria bacterium]|nr:helix-turn-helix domain-containing protein [Gammaproteobacteria bacterium]
MNISDLLSDEAILAEIGVRMARRRLDMGLTQAELAEQAGVAKRTVERIEAGSSAQLSSLIRLFRVLELLPRLDLLLPEPAPSPMELLRHKGKQRKRAPGRRKAGGMAEDKPWTWGDDE